MRLLTGFEDPETFLEALRTLAAVSSTLEHAADRVEQRDTWSAETARIWSMMKEREESA